MGFLTAKQFSEKWGISERRIIKLCKEDRIVGALKNGMVWLIPEETLKPSDKRRKISQYIQTQKNIAVININNKIAEDLLPSLKKEGYNIVATYEKTEKLEVNTKEANIFEIDIENKSSLKNFLNSNGKYFNGVIYIELENEHKNKEWLIKEFAKKMDCESSIVLVNKFKENRKDLSKKLALELNNDIGVRINTLDLKFPESKNAIIDYKEISNDIIKLLTGFKNTTGTTIESDVRCIEFLKNGRTKNLSKGEFYKILNYYFNKLNKESNMWAASMMLEDEWTEEPLEMNFRIVNLEAANRGANIERIFIFSKSKIKEFKENKTLKVYMQNSNINTLFVDYDEVLKKEPELLKEVGNGWDGFNQEAIAVDIPDDEKSRGYISSNEEEVKKAYEIFKRLKKYSKDLREILK